MRRVHLRGRENILKRLLVHAAAFNLSLLLRTALGAGTPRQLQGSLLTLFSASVRLLASLSARMGDDEKHSARFAAQSAAVPGFSPEHRATSPCGPFARYRRKTSTSATGC